MNPPKVAGLHRVAVDCGMDDEELIEDLRDEQLQVVAAERDRIAGELHDDSVQVMTTVSLQLQRLISHAEGDDLALLERARSMTDQAIERLRHMLFVLHPATLADDGLVVTLEVYLESYVESEDVEWTLEGDESLTLPVGVAALAFRLAREAIANTLRHAGAARIAVSVVEEPIGNLVLTVIDNGVGFDASDRRQHVGHLGRSHCENLAAAALGSYTVTSAVGAGTTVRIELPIGEIVGDATAG